MTFRNVIAEVSDQNAGSAARFFLETEKGEKIYPRSK
jgi:hypothetical protein